MMLLMGWLKQWKVWVVHKLYSFTILSRFCVYWFQTLFLLFLHATEVLYCRLICKIYPSTRSCAPCVNAYKKKQQSGRSSGGTDGGGTGSGGTDGGGTRQCEGTLYRIGQDVLWLLREGQPNRKPAGTCGRPAPARTKGGSYGILIRNRGRVRGLFSYKDCL